MSAAAKKEDQVCAFHEGVESCQKDIKKGMVGKWAFWSMMVLVIGFLGIGATQINLSIVRIENRLEKWTETQERKNDIWTKHFQDKLDDCQEALANLKHKDER